MRTLVVYSTVTGNTRQVADGILSALPPDTLCIEAQHAPEPDGYDLIISGFWVNKGRADRATRDYLAKIRGKKTAFFFTLGAYPDSEHADEVAADTEKILVGNGNTVLGHFRCQGRVDPELLERMQKTLPPDHPHLQMTPERQARLAEAAKHPNDTDVSNARAFMIKILGSL